MTNVSYIKIGASLFLVEKPDWIYNGAPPEPRMFELQPSKQVNTVTSNDNIDGNQMNYVSGDHCNTDSLLSYKLVKMVKTPTSRARTRLSPAARSSSSSSTRRYGGSVRRSQKTKTKKTKTKTKKSKTKTKSSKHSIGKKHKMRKVSKVTRKKGMKMRHGKRSKTYKQKK